VPNVPAHENTMIRSFKKPSAQALALNPYIVEICRGVITMRCALPSW
jgi:hypothetical protein